MPVIYKTFLVATQLAIVSRSVDGLIAQTTFRTFISSCKRFETLKTDDKFGALFTMIKEEDT